MKRIMIAAVVSLYALATMQAQAAGIANSDFSASGVGVANANVAGIADVSAASYNPAAIAWLDGVRIQGAFASRFRNSSEERVIGVESNNGKAKNTGGVHASWMPHDSNFGVSMAFTQPFSSYTVWGGDRTEIKSDRLSVDLIYAISSTLAVAHGIDIYQFKANLTQARARFSGKDKASFGVNIGVNWKPAPQWAVGLMLRSGTKAKIKSGAQQLNLDLPEQVNVGVSHDIGDAVRVEADLGYERWSRMKNLNVQGSAISYATDLKDTFALRTSATWYWLPDTTLRMGYAYEQGANSTSRFQRAIADQAGHTLSMGAGGEIFGMHIDIAYAYTFHSKQSTTGLIAGTYRDRKQTLAVSISKAF